MINHWPDRVRQFAGSAPDGWGAPNSPLLRIATANGIDLTPADFFPSDNEAA